MKEQEQASLTDTVSVALPNQQTSIIKNKRAPVSEAPSCARAVVCRAAHRIPVGSPRNGSLHTLPACPPARRPCWHGPRGPSGMTADATSRRHPYSTTSPKLIQTDADPTTTRERLGEGGQGVDPDRIMSGLHSWGKIQLSPFLGHVYPSKKIHPKRVLAAHRLEFYVHKKAFFFMDEDPSMDQAPKTSPDPLPALQ